MDDVITVIGEAAAVVDPNGEGEDISILCGLIGWALTHRDEYDGWTQETLGKAVAWSFGAGSGFAEEVVRRLPLASPASA